MCLLCHDIPLMKIDRSKLVWFISVCGVFILKVLFIINNYLRTNSYIIEIGCAVSDRIELTLYHK